MQPRAAAPTAAAAEPTPGDLLQLDAAAAADAVRSRAIAGAVGSGFGVGAGFINLQRQLGREELRGSAAGTSVLSAADVEAASWIGYYMDHRRPDAQKPRVPGVLGFEQQLRRAAVAANAAATAAPEAGKETGDVDGGVYEPRLGAVWPAAAAAGFTSAARPAAVVAAPAEEGAKVAKQATSAVQEGVYMAVTGAARSGKLVQQQPQLSMKQRLQLLKSYNKQKLKEQQQKQ
jgi:hypothetical protein